MGNNAHQTKPQPHDDLLRTMPSGQETIPIHKALPTPFQKSRFSGERRPKLKRMCTCGCRQTFITTDPRKIYKTDAHRKRFDRARMRTNDKETTT
jgi:hypothetical protein